MEQQETQLGTKSPNTEMFYIEGEPQEVVKARQILLDEFSDLEFYEEPHIYLLNGKQIPSASTIVERFLSEPFDRQAIADNYAYRKGQTAEYWLREWECTAFKATTLGTKCHEFGESLAYLYAGHKELIRPSVAKQYNESLNYLAPIHPKEEAVEMFLKALPSSYHLVLNEAKAYSGKNPDSSKNPKEQICGTFDMLYYYDGEGNKEKAGFILFDYKTNSKLTNSFSRKNNTMMKCPFDNLFQEPLGEYTIQLSLYSLMIEDLGLKVLGRKLIWLGDDGKFQKISLPDVSGQLRECI